MDGKETVAMRLQTIPQFVRRNRTFLLALVMVGALACSTSEEPPVASNADETVGNAMAASRAASAVYFDEDGNRISRPKDAPPIVSPSRQGESVPEARKSSVEGGGVQVDLGDRGIRYRVATKDASGNIQLKETRDVEAFVQAKQTEEAAPTAEEKGGN
jgi:hypothetical protein